MRFFLANQLKRCVARSVAFSLPTRSARLSSMSHVLQQRRPEARDESMDLFAQAMAGKGGKESMGGSQQGDAAEKAEAERIRRLNESAEREEKEQRQKSARFNTGVLIASLTGMYIYMGFESAADPTKEDETFFQAHNRRVFAELVGIYNYWTKPEVKKILPEPLPAPYQQPYTLCIELNDALVNLVWDKSLGWRVAVRPGAKQMIANLSRYFEVVIFTTSQGYIAEPVINALDPFQYSTYRLYRDHTTIEKGMLVKDLSLLNRDLGKIIIVDTDEENFRLQPENGILVSKWHGEAGDDSLKRMETFLHEMAILLQMMNTNDLRPILKTVKTLGEGDAALGWQKHKDSLRAEFTRLQDEARANSELSKPKAVNSVVKSITGLLGSIVGLNRTAPIMASSSSSSLKLSESANLVDLLEQSAKEDLAAFLKHQEESISQMKEMRKQQEDMFLKQMEENKKKNLTLVDYMSGAGQPPVPGQEQPQEQQQVASSS